MGHYRGTACKLPGESSNPRRVGKSAKGGGGGSWPISSPFLLLQAAKTGELSPQYASFSLDSSFSTQHTQFQPVEMGLPLAPLSQHQGGTLRFSRRCIFWQYSGFWWEIPGPGTPCCQELGCVCYNYCITASYLPNLSMVIEEFYVLEEPMVIEEFKLVNVALHKRPSVRLSQSS